MNVAKLALLLVCIGWVGIAARGSAEEPKAAPAAASKPKITIGKETTYITEPLRPDGYPDYVAALNQRMSEGVTPENNAAVLLIKAIGPEHIPKDQRVEFFGLLGVAQLPEKGEYFVPQHEIIRLWKAGELAVTEQVPDDPYDAFTVTSERPWSAQEFPVAAEWLKRNERPLQQIVEATKRPKFFVPRTIGNLLLC